MKNTGLIRKRIDYIDEKDYKPNKCLATDNLSLLVFKEKADELGDTPGYYISSIFHEFRNILSTIYSSNEILKTLGYKLEESEKEKHYNRINYSVEFLLNIVNEFLSQTGKMSAYNQFSPVLSNLHDLIDGVVKTNRMNLNESISIELHYITAIEEFIFDPAHIKNAIHNLLTNAVKYSPAGGKISVTVYAMRKKIYIEIKDEGVGILKEDIPKLFEPFFRGGNIGRIFGTGLGLSFVKKSIELHNGAIQVESEAGRGSRFIVELPIVI